MDAKTVDLRVADEDALESQPTEAYERLLGDALTGDPRLFTWQDMVEQAWRSSTPWCAMHHPRTSTSGVAGGLPRRTT